MEQNGIWTIKKIKYIYVPLHAKYFPKSFFLLFRFLYLLPRYKTYRSSTFFNIAIFSLISNVHAVPLFFFFFFQFLMIIFFFLLANRKRQTRGNISRNGISRMLGIIRSIFLDTPLNFPICLSSFDSYCFVPAICP